VLGKQGLFWSFNPAMSASAKKAKGKQIRDWHLNRRSGTDLASLAREMNPQVRGWFGYYGAFYRSELYSLARRIDQHLVRWAMQKFKRLRGRTLRTWAWLAVFVSTNSRSSPIGTWSQTPNVGLWEPGKSRDLRRVLREPGGAIPPGHSSRHPRKRQKSHFQEAVPGAACVGIVDRKDSGAALLGADPAWGAWDGWRRADPTNWPPMISPNRFCERMATSIVGSSRWHRRHAASPTGLGTFVRS